MSSPEGVVTAPVGRTHESADGVFYVKATTGGNTGWVQMAPSSSIPTVPTGGRLLNGTAVPAAGTGDNGDFYLRSTGDLYGPKAAGAWGAIAWVLSPPA